MKKQFALCTFILFLVLSTFMSIPVSAVNTRFESHEAAKDETDEFVSNVKPRYITKEPDKQGISCFDVNYDGLIAIVYDFSKTIVVYDVNGNFKYGYKVDASGSIQAEWDGDNINIYFIRSDCILSITPDGNVAGMLEIDDSSNNRYAAEKLSAHKRTVNGNEYAVRDILDPLDILSIEHSQLVIKDSDGTERVIFDVTPKLLIVRLIIITLAVLLIVTVIRAILKQKKKFIAENGSRKWSESSLLLKKYLTVFLKISLGFAGFFVILAVLLCLTR